MDDNKYEVMTNPQKWGQGQGCPSGDRASEIAYDEVSFSPYENI